VLARFACWLLGKLAPDPHVDPGDDELDIFPPRLDAP
jgi:hypothetical protein